MDFRNDKENYSLAGILLNLRRIYEGFTCDQIHDIGILIVTMDLQIKYKTVIA